MYVHVYMLSVYLSVCVLCAYVYTFRGRVCYACVYARI